VRLSSWLGQARDFCVIARDTLGHELQRIEGSHDGQPTTLLRIDAFSRSGSCASCYRGERQQAGKAQPHQANQHGNHFH
jgi:hypothetical protein